MNCLKSITYIHFVQNGKGLGEVLLQLVQGLTLEAAPLAHGNAPEWSVALGDDTSMTSK